MGVRRVWRSGEDVGMSSRGLSCFGKNVFSQAIADVDRLEVQ